MTHIKFNTNSTNQTPAEAALSDVSTKLFTVGKFEGVIIEPDCIKSRHKATGCMVVIRVEKG